MPSLSLKWFDVFSFEHIRPKEIFWIQEIPLQEICSLPHLFCPGMVLRCSVAKLDISKGGLLSIKLSVDPKLVNKALTTSSLKAGMVINQWTSCEIWPFSCTFLAHVWFTLWKFQVLSGCVESVEDHGYIVDIGVKGTNAFLPRKNTPNDQEGVRDVLKWPVLYRWCHWWIHNRCITCTVHLK